MPFVELPYDVQEVILFMAVELPNSFEDGYEIALSRAMDVSRDEYWKTEKQRGVLRLVCREWKECMDLKTHRLLHLWDYHLGKVSKTNFRAANRIIIDLPPGEWWRCYCPRCKSACSLTFTQKRELEESGSGHDFQTYYDLDTLVTNAVPDIPNSKATTLEIVGYDALKRSSVGLLVSKFADIKYLFIAPLINIDYLGIISSLSSLRYLNVRLASIRSPMLVSLIPEFPKLLSIVLFWTELSLEYGYFRDWKIPNLQYLRVITNGQGSLDVGRQFGPIAPQLVGFQLNTLPEINVKFWSLFRRLGRLHISYAIRPDFHLPPEGHPLNALVLPPIRMYNNPFYLSQVCRWAENIGALREVYFDDKWSTCFVENMPLMGSSECALCVEVINFFNTWYQRGIGVYDRFNTAFDEHICSNLIKLVNDQQRAIVGPPDSH